MKELLALIKKPSAVSLAQQELEDAQRSFLQSQSAAEYASSMSAYHEQRIKRLKAYLRTHHTKEQCDGPVD